VLGAVGRWARDLWRKATRQSPPYPEERAARAERVRRAHQETQVWDTQHHMPPGGGPGGLGGPG
jgi:hypothetical protein